jgi:glutaminyl-tRNA synthetase
LAAAGVCYCRVQTGAILLHKLLTLYGADGIIVDNNVPRFPGVFDPFRLPAGLLLRVTHTVRKARNRNEELDPESQPFETVRNDSEPLDFIREIVANHMRQGTYGGKVLTRFPPEPNGWLHIGHAKSICLNFGVAEEFGGLCNLRFDDTNPETEDMRYVEAIMRDIQWLGFDWENRLYYASDYFEKFYECALELVKSGKAYVDSQSEEEIRTNRGTVLEPGVPSPYRSRSVDENLDLLERMRAGEFEDGAHVLRAKIDMASPNMKMRDPLLYRIRHADHYRTGDKWCIYPMYDFAHPLSDAIEGITHSICTLEFENNREIYDWLVDNLFPPPRPRQYEFARLNLDYTVMSKRKLLQLVEEDYVAGWDDPRMPTIAGMRRRGITPEAIRMFSDRIGVAKTNSRVETSLFEYYIRDDLNYRAPRVMCVLRPLKVVIENYPEGETEEFDAPHWPHDVPNEGSRFVPFSREIYIEQDDFMEDPPQSYYRLAPGREVRLRYAYIIKCEDVIHDPDTGEVVEVRATYDPDTRGGTSPSGRRVRGTIHWVSAPHAASAEVRLYDRLFLAPNPDDAEEGKTFKDYINPNSLDVVEGALVEPSILNDPVGTRYQFERLGYFISDTEDSLPGKLVYNRIITLRDSWSRTAEDEVEPATSRGAKRSAAEPDNGANDESRRSRTEMRDARRAQTPELHVRLHRYTEELGLPFEEADVLTGDLQLAQFFDDAVRAYGNARSVSKWVTNEVMRELKERDIDQLPFDGAQVGVLAKLVDDGTITASAAKDLFDQMATEGGDPEQIVRERSLQQIANADELEPIVREVVAANPDKAQQYRDGKAGLLGFFIGQVMRATQGRANPMLVESLVKRELG